MNFYCTRVSVIRIEMGFYCTCVSVIRIEMGFYCTCIAVTRIEMGFQGVLTRWGMKGGPASHGVTKAHRRLGSIGGGGDKGGIWKGKKMPGHMGSLWRYHRGVQVCVTLDIQLRS